MTPFGLRRLATGAAVLVLWIGTPAQAQRVVFDPTNYASNVLQAARSLDQINNQIRSLQNQALSLVNQARNLAQLPYSALATIQGNLTRIGGLMQQAQRIAYDVQSIDQAFKADYSLKSGASDAALILSAKQRWMNSAAAFRDALNVQATVVGNMSGGRSETQALVAASQGASGAVATAQAGNQLLALQSQQLSDLTALLAAQGRASALDQADRAASRDQAQEQFRRFMDRGQGYQPQSVEMFR